jgi:hypothetical protein
VNNLVTTINYIVSRSTELKNTFTDASSAPVEFSCIFCQNEEEYKDFTLSIEALGEVVERTPSGFTYLLKNPVNTIAGPLRLVKIRKPDIQRPERGDADFNTNYNNFKIKYLGKPGFEFLKRESFEMLRLSNPTYDVMACFSNIPKSKNLGIKL